LNGEKHEPKLKEVVVPVSIASLAESTATILKEAAKLKQATSQPALSLTIGRRPGSQTLLKPSPMQSPLSSRPTPLDTRNPSPENQLKAVAPWIDASSTVFGQSETPFDANFLLNEDLRDIIDFDYLNAQGTISLLPQNMEDRRKTPQGGSPEPNIASPHSRMSPFAGLLQAYGITDKAHEQVNEDYGTGLESIARLYKSKGSEIALQEAVHQAEVALNEHHQEPMNDWIAGMIQNAGFLNGPEKYHIENELARTDMTETPLIADNPSPVSTDTLKLECRRILRDFFVPGGCKELNIDEIFRLQLFFDVERDRNFNPSVFGSILNQILQTLEFQSFPNFLRVVNLNMIDSLISWNRLPMSPKFERKMTGRKSSARRPSRMPILE